MVNVLADANGLSNTSHDIPCRADFFLLVACFVRGSAYHEGLKITAGELERGIIFHCIQDTPWNSLESSIKFNLS